MSYPSKCLDCRLLSDGSDLGVGACAGPKIPNLFFGKIRGWAPLPVWVHDRYFMVVGRVGLADVLLRHNRWTGHDSNRKMLACGCSQRTELGLFGRCPKYAGREGEWLAHLHFGFSLLRVPSTKSIVCWQFSPCCRAASQPLRLLYIWKLPAPLRVAQLNKKSNNFYTKS